MSEEVWQEYRRTGDLALRNRLVLTYVPLVKHIVCKKIRELPASCEVDDLISCGIETLIGTIDRYDPSKGASLEAHLWTRIHGAVLDELRRRDWAPRSLRIRPPARRRARSSGVRSSACRRATARSRCCCTSRT
jgi:RNA polymerase sigma factor for flagellar operon FliA